MTTHTRDVIPAITDPLGKHWRQPARDRILVDDKHAVMDRAALSELAEYSRSMPTGAYPGKMWRCALVADSRADSWLLCWFDYLDDQNCSIHTREILIV